MMFAAMGGSRTAGSHGEQGAEGVGLATVAGDGTVLDTWFPAPKLCDPRVTGTTHLDAEDLAKELDGPLAAAIGSDALRGVRVVAVRTSIRDLDEPPIDVHDVYLRLHLLSKRFILPHGASLEGIFDLLRNDIAWTSHGPCLASESDAVQARARAQRTPLTFRGVFMIPPMLDYVRPSGVRIADANRVLLGAYLAAGTAVLPEGFCGINAGVLGPCMIEGRISAGVVVGARSDIGGGASIMGTTSGGGRHVVRVGERCLLGANSGIGISLGDDCIVEAGCYITAGARVKSPSGKIVKALELSGRSGLLFRRNSETGALEALEGANKWTGLNPKLHPTDSSDYPAEDARRSGNGRAPDLLSTHVIPFSNR